MKKTMNELLKIASCRTTPGVLNSKTPCAFTQMAFVLTLFILLTFSSIDAARLCNSGATSRPRYFCDEKNPAVFHICMNNNLHTLVCPGILHFNLRTQTCDWPDSTNCVAENKLYRERLLETPSKNDVFKQPVELPAFPMNEPILGSDITEAQVSRTQFHDAQMRYNQISTPYPWPENQEAQPDYTSFTIEKNAVPVYLTNVQDNLQFEPPYESDDISANYQSQPNDQNKYMEYLKPLNIAPSEISESAHMELEVVTPQLNNFIEQNQNVEPFMKGVTEYQQIDYTDYYYPYADRETSYVYDVPQNDYAPINDYERIENVTPDFNGDARFLDETWALSDQDMGIERLKSTTGTTTTTEITTTKTTTKTTTTATPLMTVLPDENVSLDSNTTALYNVSPNNEPNPYYQPQVPENLTSNNFNGSSQIMSNTTEHILPEQRSDFDNKELDGFDIRLKNASDIYVDDNYEARTLEQSYDDMEANMVEQKIEPYKASLPFKKNIYEDAKQFNLLEKKYESRPETNTTTPVPQTTSSHPKRTRRQLQHSRSPYVPWYRSLHSTRSHPKWTRRRHADFNQDPAVPGTNVLESQHTAIGTPFRGLSQPASVNRPILENVLKNQPDTSMWYKATKTSKDTVEHRKHSPFNKHPISSQSGNYYNTNSNALRLSESNYVETRSDSGVGHVNARISGESTKADNSRMESKQDNNKEESEPSINYAPSWVHKPSKTPDKLEEQHTHSSNLQTESDNYVQTQQHYTHISHSEDRWYRPKSKITKNTNPQRSLPPFVKKNEFDAQNFGWGNAPLTHSHSNAGPAHSPVMKNTNDGSPKGSDTIKSSPFSQRPSPQYHSPSTIKEKLSSPNTFKQNILLSPNVIEEKLSSPNTFKQNNILSPNVIEEKLSSPNTVKQNNILSSNVITEELTSTNPFKSDNLWTAKHGVLGIPDYHPKWVQTGHSDDRKQARDSNVWNKYRTPSVIKDRSDSVSTSDTTSTSASGTASTGATSSITTTTNNKITKVPINDISALETSEAPWWSTRLTNSPVAKLQTQPHHPQLQQQTHGSINKPASRHFIRNESPPTELQPQPRPQPQQHAHSHGTQPKTSSQYFTSPKLPSTELQPQPRTQPQLHQHTHGPNPKPASPFVPKPDIEAKRYDQPLNYHTRVPTGDFKLADNIDNSVLSKTHQSTKPSWLERSFELHDAKDRNFALHKINRNPIFSINSVASLNHKFKLHDDHLDVKHDHSNWKDDAKSETAGKSQKSKQHKKTDDKKEISTYKTSPIDKYSKKPGRCSSSWCQLPNCRCIGTSIPGDFEAKDVPQMIMLTFDDSINFQNIGYYNQLFNGTLRNPNGCNIRSTFYVSGDNTDYGMVKQIYKKGNEIASHTLSHRSPSTWWGYAGYDNWEKEIVGMKERLSEKSGIPLKEIEGMRAPFLQVGGDAQYAMLKDHKFRYDTSMVTGNLYRNNNPPMWPFTLDTTPDSQTCTLTPCPTRSYPGLWEVPLIRWYGSNRMACAMPDACTLDLGVKGTRKFLDDNFQRHYTTNRAPFGIFIHASWFGRKKGNFEGLYEFLESMNDKDDVWVVTVSQALDWVQRPVRLSGLKVSMDSWKC